MQIRKSNTNKIVLSTLRMQKLVEVQEISYCEAEGSCTKIVLLDGVEFTSTKPLKEIEKKLKEHSFFRINRSQLVNMDAVKEIHKKRNTTITLKNEKALIISHRKIPQFNQFIKLMY